ncbi:MAG: S-methyl-5-thioribose-1-phosphate isomerase [Bacteroidales bacterium]|nr:S-methyl-5-thioribose-1-phosphate isomerase [Bacteroidales bacterium]
MYRSIWQDESDQTTINVIDQRRLPFSYEVLQLRSVNDVCTAISDMAVRGAPLIGAAAAWGIWFSFLEHRAENNIKEAILFDADRLKATRPTAVNLSWAVDRMTEVCEKNPESEALRTAAARICDEEAWRSKKIGEYGLELLRDISYRKGGGTVNILTHCNAGWLACVDYGTALAPVYLAHDKGIRVHVWVDETRPRNQGARLTAWELSNHGVPFTLVADNAGGHLMQNGLVDIVIVGCDRATTSGDVANKIGTYLKALAAHDNGIPFYSAFPVSTFDMTIDSPEQIMIEERDGDEIKKIDGIPENVLNIPVETLHATSLHADIQSFYICQPGISVSNYGFDVTPARLVTGIITDRGICRADKDSILKLLS